MQQPQLGLKISELRKQKGLTQEELVDQCNINVRTLQRIENGEVSPRSYTVKTILSALDYDYESLQEQRENNLSQLASIPAPEAKSIFTLLTIGWVGGILFFITAIFEGFTDFGRIDDNLFIFGQWGHVVIKALVIVFNGLVLYGFLIAGNVLKNHLMKISSMLMFLVLLGYYAFDIASVFNTNLNIDIILLAGAIGFGVTGIIFGISLLQSRKQVGGLATALGILEIIMAGCLLLVILAPLAYFLLMPVIVLEVLVLYKIASLVKSQF
ncbi:helix-turn-helix transcriptional regulator [Croceitalea sp. P059]|uniref:helix-turn-helix domain-containing protein n=1 Tax=Croceitalea sp. P059 TaxID=3075601 RepID=UPI002883662F|nr:helix-turn-helix transcriptional regulator [Croceitalea sp. P059]MDT0539029.1 helix-turn-helix transcriptional regulator [Croceitalea sp. P059]